MIQNIAQLRRLTFRYKAKATDDWTVVNFDEDQLGQDSSITFNVAPRMRERASQKGTTSSPIAGSYDNFSASLNLLADTFETIGKVLNRWEKATYAGAGAGNGRVLFGGPDNTCADQPYIDVIASGVCDDGSSTDVEFTRCYPCFTDDIEIGTSETASVSVALNPQIYNTSLHSSDGYPQYDARLGDYSLTTKQRLNVTTGVYADVDESES